MVFGELCHYASTFLGGPIYRETVSCKTPDGKPEKSLTDSCGLGLGNHIRILHKDGFVSFYVHLEKVLVETGDLVKAGQPIGIEGWTGLAGHRHLHWDVNKLYAT
jgi:murein DD-endopeptidase MepM/ murein hydrolase activator NlpD